MSGQRLPIFKAVRLSPGLLNQIAEYGEKNDLSVSAALRALVRAGLRAEQAQVRAERNE